ncbi:hemolysin family protein [Frankia sp. AgKG'84/4]|nr:hemolysin family protein [Frankia sp. AgKG'84/4]
MTLIAIVVGFALVAGNAFFVGAEFAFVSARRERLEPMVEAGDRRARSVIGALEHLSPLLAATQLGVTLCSLALGAVAEPSVAGLLAHLLHTVGVPDAGRHAIAFALALAVVSAVHMVLGEIVPKNLSIAGPEQALRWLGPPLIAFARATSPFVLLLNGFANRVLRLLRVTPRDELAAAYGPSELAVIIAESTHEGLLEQAEHQRLTSALELAEHAVGAVMIPLARTVTVPWTTSARELEAVVARTGFSRFPVRAPADTDDGPGLAGFLHAKDVLGITPEEIDAPLAPHRLHRMAELAADTPLDQALRRMQRTGSHLGRVTDAAGRTVGVVAMEDVVVQFVGEVTDASHHDASHHDASHHDTG